MYNGKVDLHLHLDGAITETFFRKYAHKYGLVVPADLRAALSVTSGCRDLRDYLRCFSLPTQLLQWEDVLEECAYDLIRRLSAQGLLYAEIRFAPTQANYEAKIYQHIIPELGKIPLNQLAQKDLQQFYARMKTSGRLIRTKQFGKGLSDSMVRGLHAACRSALEKAVQEELIRTNPAVGCKLPPKRGREMQVLGREELQRFLIQAQAEGYFELFLLD